MYIWKLKPIIEAEGSVAKIVEKARRAKISALWVKIAEGRTTYPNVTGSMAAKMDDLVKRCHAKNIEVWGWHIPICATSTIAKQEAKNVQAIASQFKLDGIIMDAENGAQYFQGDKDIAAVYAKSMRNVADAVGKPLAISSHDIPQNFKDWLPKFNKIAAVCDVNYPQAYYGGSPSVENRLSRAEAGNAHVTIPFAPVGAAWVGKYGGCASATACAERGREFIRLVKDRGYKEYSFWHWAGAPSAFWAVLNTTQP